jgi:hypothetical protein
VESKVNSEINKTVDKTIDGVFKPKKKENEKNPSSIGLGSSVNVQYQFRYLVVVKTISNTRTESKTFALPTDDPNYTALADDNPTTVTNIKSLVINDYKNKWMMTTNIKEKTASGMTMPYSVGTAEGMNKEADGDYSPTGRTKIIAGKACKEYKHTNNGVVANFTVWATTEFPTQYGRNKIFSSYGAIVPNSNKIGCFMEINQKSSEGDLTHSYESIKAINLDIDFNQYKVVKF